MQSLHTTNEPIPRQWKLLRVVSEDDNQLSADAGPEGCPSLTTIRLECHRPDTTSSPLAEMRLYLHLGKSQIPIPNSIHTRQGSSNTDCNWVGIYLHARATWLPGNKKGARDLVQVAFTLPLSNAIAE
ncbi:hypothetical protein N7493_004192 [Penicillium malachiteum]|uniref:Uncharacterized protein n=1 Tax=Penicillium malachiteum TaxID=1324776 RepID=A0AAD6MYC8_9EURO|nr:hypothetical protein N7493_004192 [Penicillium malachiteum]